MDVKDITHEKDWERFIAVHAPTSLFQSWAWGETIKSSHLQAPASESLRRLGFYEGKKLVGIAQVQVVRARRGRFLHARHGPILSEWKESSFIGIVEHLKKIARKDGAWFLRISPHIDPNPSALSYLANAGFAPAPIHAMDGERCWIVDLAGSENDLLSRMRKTTRYSVKAAGAAGVVITKSDKLEDLESFFPLYEQTARRQGFVKHVGVREEFAVFSARNQVLLFRGWHDNSLIAAALILFYNDQAIYHHSASLPSKAPVNYLLQWEVIREAKKRGMKEYNMWGIAPEGNDRHPWKGLTLFKKGFGGEEKEFLHAHDLPISPLYWVTYGIETARKVRKGY